MIQLTAASTSIADFQHMPKWNYFVIRIDNVTAHPNDVGTRFRQVRPTDGQDYDITRLEPTGPSRSPPRRSPGRPS